MRFNLLPSISAAALHLKKTFLDVPKTDAQIKEKAIAGLSLAATALMLVGGLSNYTYIVHGSSALQTHIKCLN